MPNEFDVPIESIKAPNPELMTAIQKGLAEITEPAPAPVVAPETEFVDPAAAAAEPVVPVDPAVVDPAAPPVDPAATPPVEPVVEAVVEPVVEPVVEAPKRPSDEFGELPETYKKETRDRFEGLKTKFDEVYTRAERAEQAASTWHETIASTGASPEQFGELLLFAKDVNSGTAEGLRSAYETVTRQQAALAKALGLPATGYDPLDDYPDLKDRVETSVDFTRDDALLIAQARAGSKLAETSSQRLDQQTQAQREHQAGIQQVADLGQQLRAANPAMFQAKFDFLAPMIERVTQKLPPAEWASEIKLLYERLPMPAAPPPTPVPRVPNGIRPSGSPASLDKKPASALEAVAMGLARMSGGG